MPGSVKVNNSWKTATGLSVKVAGTWRTATSAFVNVGGVWKQWFASKIQDTFARASTVSGLGTSETGQIWTALRGNWRVGGSNNALSDDAASTYPIASINFGNSDVKIQADTSGGTGVSFWVTSAGSWWASYPEYTSSTAFTCDQNVASCTGEGCSPSVSCCSGIATSYTYPCNQGGATCTGSGCTPSGCCSGVSYSGGVTTCNAGSVTNTSNPPSASCCSGITTGGGGTSYVCDQSAVSCSNSSSSSCAGLCCSSVGTSTSGGGATCTGTVASDAAGTGCCSGVTTVTSYTDKHAFDGAPITGAFTCRYVGSANTAVRDVTGRFCTAADVAAPYYVSTCTQETTCNSTGSGTACSWACPSGYQTSGTLCSYCDTGQTGSVSGCGSAYSCYTSSAGTYTTCATGTATGETGANACGTLSTSYTCQKTVGTAPIVTSYYCYTSTRAVTAATTYQCFTSTTTSAITGSCFTSTSTVTNRSCFQGYSSLTTYTTKLVIASSVSGTVVSQASSTLSSSTSGYTAVGSVYVTTVGDTITARAYSGAGLTTALGSNLVHTPASPTKGTSVGIIKAPSTGSQGSTLDNFLATIQENNMTESRPARPWDLFNKNIGRVETDIAQERLAICKGCDKFISATTQCKECGCIMKLKTKLPNASCPLHKWEAVDISYKEEI